MKCTIIFLITLVILVIFISGCILNNSDTWDTSTPLEKHYSITTLQDYDSSLCTNLDTINGGYGYIGLKLKAYDVELGDKINTDGEMFTISGQNGPVSDSDDKGFGCFQTDPTFPILVTVYANIGGYTPIIEMDIGSLPVGKMYLIKVAMQNKTNKKSCYDQYNLKQYYEFIKEIFGINSNQYTLKCMDSDITRGGFIESEGKFNQGGEFELLYRWGWCSSGETDCGGTKCFAAEGNDELFETVKNKLCNEISSRSDHDEYLCSTFPVYNNTDEIRQKCLDGEYEYSIGNKKVISIIQNSDKCSSSVGKGSSECLSIS